MTQPDLTQTQPKTGRPTSLTPDRVKRFTDAVRLGSTYVLAAQYAGFHHATFQKWLKRAEKAIATAETAESPIPPEEEPFVEFYAALKKAEGDAVVGWLAKIEKEANEGSWQAAAWKLERRYAKDYGRSVVTNEVTGTDGGPVQVRFYIPDNGRDTIGDETGSTGGGEEDEG